MTPQELKNSVLQRAIQGKLVEQRPEEGTGEELYQAIQAEKRRLIKSGELKKEKPLPEISEDEKPFDIPDSWTFVYLDDIVRKNVRRGKSPVYSLSGNTLVFAQKCNVKTGGINLSLAQFLDETALSKYPPEEWLLDGDIVINSTGTGTLGRVGLFRNSDNPQNKPIVPDSHVTVVRPIEGVFFLYVFYALRFYQPYLESQGDGSTKQKELKPLTIRSLLFPLPPLLEQRRIVAKIEELLPYIDRYAAAWERLETFNRRFPSDMRKSLLQMAIQGKLVEQRPEEGNGEELYRAIQAEKQRLMKSGKLKKEKPLPEISAEEIPFDTPDNWKWLRLGNIITLLSGTDFKPEEYNAEGKGTPYITGASNFTQESLIVNRWTDKPKVIANDGDILLVCKGSGYGKTIVCNLTEAHIARQIMAVKRNNLLDMRYIRYFLSANFNLLKSRGQGVIPGIERKAVLELAFPLPPLAEQRRIVARLEELLPLCGRLE